MFCRHVLCQNVTCNTCLPFCAFYVSFLGGVCPPEVRVQKAGYPGWHFGLQEVFLGGNLVEGGGFVPSAVSLSLH